MNKIKTPSDLKWHVEQAGHDSHFFTRPTMRFFGDTMRNYSVRQPQEVETYSGKVMAYELARKRPVKHGLCKSAYFDSTSFAQVFIK